MHSPIELTIAVIEQHFKTFTRALTNNTWKNCYQQPLSFDNAGFFN
jgi:hypothetical protein